MSYSSRREKTGFISKMFPEVLSGGYLDVGADQQYVKPVIENSGGSYFSMGRGTEMDYDLDLEGVPLPLESESVRTVACLDVLEHLESIHFTVDELFRVAERYVLISLPNPVDSFFAYLKNGRYSDSESIKFYGLPLEPPADRHRWFFTADDAERFLNAAAKRNGFNVLRLVNKFPHGKLFGGSSLGIFFRFLLRGPFQSLRYPNGVGKGAVWMLAERSESRI